LTAFQLSKWISLGYLLNALTAGHSTVKCPNHTQTLTQPLKKKKERKLSLKKTENANDWKVVQRPSGMKQRADMIEKCQ
jgi:hypothetical protein